MKFRTVLATGLFVASAAGCAYLACAVARTIAFGRRRNDLHAAQRADGPQASASRQALPAVTILKPLCGDEPDLFDNLASFCDQEFGRFQIIFGVREASDPAVGVAQRVVTAFPRVDASVVVDDRMPVANRKISNVLNMMPYAKHNILVVADSDVRVGRSYLRDIAAPFASAGVGAVTCLYRAAPRQRRAVQTQERLVGELAAMFVEEHFAPSVLVATALTPMDFCLGATMAVSRTALDAIGGFAGVGAYLADDQMLGRLVRERGFTVELATHVVETALEERDLAALWQHELRWAVTMHAARPLGYSLSFITYALPLACAYALLRPTSALAAALLLCAGGLRFALHYYARAALGTGAVDSPSLVLPRDLLGLAVWAAHFFCNRIRWRDAAYRLDRRGQLEPLTPAQPHQPAP
ncbi:MAG: bacteriohopanetetrol glucosamine biosynthesis glycosyltransferase HpnI [Candidatus Eremiobacteraeota bacterium]|nr:bacteriohopanetetrol glucosamine biosynthesis glycosyltransferase HpnI [Candidatus Eremiobacteraeota bacterium]